MTDASGTEAEPLRRPVTGVDEANHLYAQRGWLFMQYCACSKREMPIDCKANLQWLGFYMRKLDS
ncbi:hypothetical protein DBA20_14245 [Pandoraea capi]|nr:hypothetical protein [Pandoraea sp. LA3]MDN4584146.1 hypothetical protein [Pandoraea capi]